MASLTLFGVLLVALLGAMLVVGARRVISWGRATATLG
jgi:hypothetical protein